MTYGNLTNGQRVVPAGAPAAHLRSERSRTRHIRHVGECDAADLREHRRAAAPGADNSPSWRARSATRSVCASWTKGWRASCSPDKDALGQRIRLTQPPADGTPADMEVVGIVDRHRHDVMDEDGAASRIPSRWRRRTAQAHGSSVRNRPRTRPVETAVQALRTERRRADANLPILQQLAFALLLDSSVQLWLVRLGAVMFGFLGVIPLLPPVVGLFVSWPTAIERARARLQPSRDRRRQTR